METAAAFVEAKSAGDRRRVSELLLTFSDVDEVGAVVLVLTTWVADSGVQVGPT